MKSVVLYRCVERVRRTYLCDIAPSYHSYLCRCCWSGTVPFTALC